MIALEWSRGGVHGNRQHFRRVLRVLRLRLDFQVVAFQPAILSIAAANVSTSSSVV